MPRATGSFLVGATHVLAQGLRPSAWLAHSHAPRRGEPASARLGDSKKNREFDEPFRRRAALTVGGRKIMGTREMTAANFAEIVGKNGTVVIDCWASWCGPCRAFAPIFEAAAAKHPEITFAKVDTEAQADLAGAFQIRAIPTLMVFRDGILLFREAGLLPPAALEELLRRVAEVDMDEVRTEIAKAEKDGAEKAVAV